MSFFLSPASFDISPSPKYFLTVLPLLMALFPFFPLFSLFPHCSLLVYSCPCIPLLCLTPPFFHFYLIAFFDISPSPKYFLTVLPLLKFLFSPFPHCSLLFYSCPCILLLCLTSLFSLFPHYLL